MIKPFCGSDLVYSLWMNVLGFVALAYNVTYCPFLVDFLLTYSATPSHRWHRVVQQRSCNVTVLLPARCLVVKAWNLVWLHVVFIVCLFFQTALFCVCTSKKITLMHYDYSWMFRHVDVLFHFSYLWLLDLCCIFLVWHTYAHGTDAYTNTLLRFIWRWDLHWL